MVSYLLAGLSVLIAGGVHWKLPNSFWKASIFSTLLIVTLSLFIMFYFQSDFLSSKGDNSQDVNIVETVLIVSGLASFFALLISLLMGYFLKAIKPQA